MTGLKSLMGRSLQKKIVKRKKMKIRLGARSHRLPTEVLLAGRIRSFSAESFHVSSDVRARLLNYIQRYGALLQDRSAAILGKVYSG